MDDPGRPDANRWRRVGARGAKWRMPVPPGPPEPPKISKAEREREARAEARAEARVARLHLVSLFSVGVTVMGLVLAAVVVMFVLALTSHR
jgi:hypothetical protein